LCRSGRSGRCGCHHSERLADELAARGIIAGENKVARLCSQQRIWSVFAKRRGLARKAGPPVHDDLVGRAFTAAGPDQLWVADFERHEALSNRVEVGDLRRRVVAAAW
jgi:transposase InsO family protein